MATVRSAELLTRLAKRDSSWLDPSDSEAFDYLVMVEALRLFPEVVERRDVASYLTAVPSWLDAHQVAESRALYWTGVVQLPADEVISRLVEHCLALFARLARSQRDELRVLARQSAGSAPATITRHEAQSSLRETRLSRMRRASARKRPRLDRVPEEYRTAEEIDALERAGLDAMLTD